MTLDPSPLIAQSLSLPPASVRAALELMDEGGTVPFVARYRKERTGGLDEVQLREIASQAEALRELARRKDTVRAALAEQGRMDEAMEARIEACATRAELEELYAPYKKRRKTRADTAREQGLEPLAQRILAQARGEDRLAGAKKYVDSAKGVAAPDDALAGARDIVAEQIASEPARMSSVRKVMRERGVMVSAPKRGAEDTDRFRDYLDYKEPLSKMPSHRYLAVCRGEAQGALSLKVKLDTEGLTEHILRDLHHRPGSPYAQDLAEAADDAVKRLLLPSAERAVRADRKELADAEATNVFAQNLEALLLAAPFGPRRVLGVDPGLRTGCKCALVAETGALLEHRVLHLVPPLGGGDARPLVQWLQKTRPDAVAVGNGTGGREALAAVRAAVAEAGLQTLVVSVAESGASVYSASEQAREELPDVDLTVRSAVHLARRLQDPLAELVKVPPASIGVGQYQHDVDEALLTRRLHEVVESCVNRVGVDVNTASPALLSYVAGIGPKLAQAIVTHREQNGAFRSRKALREVKGLGPKTFEQCAGFLRVRGGDEPLDASGVHPERYALVAKMARDAKLDVAKLVGDAAAVAKLDLRRYQDEQTAASTLADIAAELARPGRDPREEFEAPAFLEGVQAITDLEPGMVLEGVVTNVTNFGAFVDIGVHQDGLVHVSELADRFVRDPHEVVRPGQRLTVRVLSVDLQRKRISLSAKSR